MPGYMRIENLADFQSWLNDRAAYERQKRSQLFENVGQAGIDYLHTHWSSPPPSAPGETPAVRTGDLDTSFTYETTENDVTIGTNINYAPMLEIGTVNMAARPYFELAMQYVAERFKVFIQEIGLG